MGASSNFGNLFSVAGASLIVPFMPMTAIQILANNMLYDLSQAFLPTDSVDADEIATPRPWNLAQVGRFILFVGPVSSLFDFVTFFVMLRVFGCDDVSTPAVAAASERLFQSGWFVESLLTQTLVVHVIRTRRIPFLQSRASTPLLLSGLAIAAVGVSITYTGVGRELGLVPLPATYWPLLTLTLAAYGATTHAVKRLLARVGWIG